jgi:chromosome segregation ATPase
VRVRVIDHDKVEVTNEAGLTFEYSLSGTTHEAELASVKKELEKVKQQLADAKAECFRLAQTVDSLDAQLSEASAWSEKYRANAEAKTQEIAELLKEQKRNAA